MRIIISVIALGLLACGGSPSSPAVITEARVLTDSNWTGTLGERGPMAGGGATPILNIGSGRQCATVRRISETGFLTLRVGSESKTTDAGRGGQNVDITVCGEGLLK